MNRVDQFPIARVKPIQHGRHWFWRNVAIVALQLAAITLFFYIWLGPSAFEQKETQAVVQPTPAACLHISELPLRKAYTGAQISLLCEMQTRHPKTVSSE